MITVAIVALLLALAVPSYQQWIANVRIRTTAEAIQNGLMLAKGEAVKRNTKVQFVLTSGDPIIGNVSSITASTTGTAWMVRVFQSGGTYTSADYVQGRNKAEGSQNVTVAAGQSTVIFTGIGGLSPIPAAAIDIDVSGSSGSGANRPLRVTVARGGAIRLCDPAIQLSTSPLGCS